jgi:hypothetical protein
MVGRQHAGGHEPCGGGLTPKQNDRSFFVESGELDAAIEAVSGAIKSTIKK